jgi:hypothetical protein
LFQRFDNPAKHHRIMAADGDGRKGNGDEATIKVASKKESKEKPKLAATGALKLRRQHPKITKLGTWKDAQADGTSCSMGCEARTG